MQNNVFNTVNLQFGFKSSSYTVMCSNMVTEAIEYYVSNNSSVYLLLINASKAFDRLRHEALFQILKQKGICLLISRILFNMYTHSTTKVRWNETYSKSFPLQNGVKQGNCLSPILFTISIEGLLERLKNAAIGCCFRICGRCCFDRP